MEASLIFGNMLWPALLTIGVISLLDYILDRKKLAEIVLLFLIF